MIKKYTIPLALVMFSGILIAIGFSGIKERSNSEKMLKIESLVIHTPSGWGYNILVDKKIFIHQESIPAIMGEKSFVSKEDAQRTADLIIKKLEKGQQPVITVPDLITLKIFLTH